MKILFSLLLLVVTVVNAAEIYVYEKCTELSFLPMPKVINCNLKNQHKQQLKNPCNIAYILKVQSSQINIAHILELIEHQQRKTFKCQSIHFGTNKQNLKKSTYEHVVQIELTDPSLRSAYTIKEESYVLKITREVSLIQAKHYVGFVRALETFLQSITCNKRLQYCYMTALPIEIRDEPLFQYRGILVDSSRHFLPIKILQETIDAMMYNKMNALHWHIVDEDSFPLQLKSHPELAQFATFSDDEKYTTEEIKKFIHYATVRGVRVIPQIDTPGHAASWARAPQNSKIACTFQDNKYKGPLDITLHQTYEMVKDVFKEVFELFPDPLVHLGGDEVSLSCLSNLTNFLKLEEIKSGQLEQHYRKKQKKMLRQLNSTKKFIYWTNEFSFATDQEDILHWWGESSLAPQVTKSKVIISQLKGQFYIDMGSGQIHGWPYFKYSTWYEMYNLNLGEELQKANLSKIVMGGELTLWSQISNIYTHHVKMWIRSSSMAERFWTAKPHKIKPDFERRITAHEKLMNRRGIPTAPITSQQCQINAKLCQFEHKSEKNGTWI